jgi:hypothetical protein
MEWKDIGLVVGIVTTFALGVGNLVYNILLSRRTAFINTVTSERVKWIGKLRENLSSFVGLTHYWFVSKNDGDHEKLESVKRELRVLRYHITLQLNPKPEAALDQEIKRLVEEIPDIASKGDTTALMDALDAIIAKGQALLKEEWDKVKREAQRGALADSSTHWQRWRKACHMWRSISSKPPPTLTA